MDCQNDIKFGVTIVYMLQVIHTKFGGIMTQLCS